MRMSPSGDWQLSLTQWGRRLHRCPPTDAAGLHCQGMERPAADEPYTLQVYNRSGAGNPQGTGVPEAAVEQTAAAMQQRGGMVLVTSLWGASDMSWFEGDCNAGSGGAPRCDLASTSVTISKLALRRLPDGFGACTPETCRPSPPPSPPAPPPVCTTPSYANCWASRCCSESDERCYTHRVGVQYAQCMKFCSTNDWACEDLGPPVSPPPPPSPPPSAVPPPTTKPTAAAALVDDRSPPPPNPSPPPPVPGGGESHLADELGPATTIGLEVAATFATFCCGCCTLVMMCRCVRDWARKRGRARRRRFSGSDSTRWATEGVEVAGARAAPKKEAVGRPPPAEEAPPPPSDLDRALSAMSGAVAEIDAKQYKVDLQFVGEEQKQAYVENYLD